MQKTLADRVFSTCYYLFLYPILLFLLQQPTFLLGVLTVGTTRFLALGLVTIVQIVRNVQMLIPAFDFCIPDKECGTSGDNPCELLRKIDFPTDEFFPPKASDCGCGCGRQN